VAATVYALHVPLIPWDAVSFDYLTSILVSNGFDIVLIVVDHVTRMAIVSPRTESITTKEITSLLLHGVYGLH
jgi:hypothetical protein